MMAERSAGGESRMIRRRIRDLMLWCAASTAALACSTPYTISNDPVANYEKVFIGVPLNRTVILNSRLEVMHRRLWGLIPMSDGNGEWEFELLADPSWLAAVRTDFEEIPWPELSLTRKVPPWFSPTPREYSLWRLQPTSHPTAHLFIARTPRDPERIHVFIRRH